MARERRTRPVTAGGLKRGRGHPAAGGRGSLTAGPHLSVPCCKKKKRRRGLGRRGNELGQHGPLARARGEADGLGRFAG
jgi:hypothetical protein